MGGNHDIEIWAPATIRAASRTSPTVFFGMQMLLNSDFVEPINSGSAEMVSINQLVDLAEDIAGIKLNRR